MQINLNGEAALQKKYLAFVTENFAEPVVDAVRNALVYRSTVALYTSGLSIDKLHELLAIFEGNKEVTKYVRGIMAVAKDKEPGVTKLDQFPEAFLRWMTIKSIDGWLYEVRESAGDPVKAWAIKEVNYEPARGSGENYIAAYASVRLVANGTSTTTRRRGNSDDLTETGFSLHAGDVSGQKPFSQILLEQGYLKETPELKADYEADNTKFLEYQPMVNVQFTAVARQRNVIVESDYEDEWSSRQTTASGLRIGDRFVCEEGLIERKFVLLKDNKMYAKYGVAEHEFRKVPVHHYIYVYDLQRYGTAWTHVNEIEPYQYKPELIEKLVLPEEHKDLINILVTDVGVFAQDIIEGKSGGTPILCYGAPGLGKTLTAEVYAEVAKKPLYKIHSGVLGTTAATVEKTLKGILERGERWGAVVLLDECDVYVAKRADNLDRNAVVAAFLRTLEYFNGLLFLTTNRVEDVDDAILSRMVAVFRYEAPNEEMSKRLWPILSQQFGLPLTDKQIDWLMTTFPGLPGRDIKNLVKLVQKYCASKGVKVSTQAFLTCAVFRGIK